MDLELQAVRDLRGQPIPPRAGLADQLVTTAYLIVPPDVTRRCTISVLGSDHIAGVPAVSADYGPASTVRVLMSGGRPVQVLGPASTKTTGSGSDIPGPPPAPAPQVTTHQTVIMPQASGTWRAIRAAWGRWGDAADTSQRHGSDPLVGLATFGDQIVGLGAASITRAVLTLVQSPTSGLSAGWGAVVQGAPHGGIPAGAPTPSGATATIGMPGRGNGTTASGDLPAGLCDALRTGAAKSLALVGSNYGTATGAGRHGQAWTLAIEYTTNR